MADLTQDPPKKIITLYGRLGPPNRGQSVASIVLPMPR